MDEIRRPYNGCEMFEAASAQSLVFCSRDDAEKVLKALNEVIRDYSQASVADLMDIVGLPSRFATHRYGWTNLISACIHVVRHGYELRLPMPEALTAIAHTAESICDEEPSASDNVEHPNHYQSETGLEAIDAIDAFTSDLTGVEAFDTGNALKYLCRWKKKNGVEDLKKAQWYINHLINHIEKENK